MQGRMTVSRSGHPANEVVEIIVYDDYPEPVLTVRLDRADFARMILCPAPGEGTSSGAPCFYDKGVGSG